MITTVEAQRLLKRVHELAVDDEAAHGTEDQLWFAVLSEIALTSTDVRCRELARIAIETAGIAFCRYGA